MSDNGVCGRISSQGGTIIDRRFGSLLIMDSGIGGEVSIDVDRVVVIIPGKAETTGGGSIYVSTVVMEGTTAPVLIASRGAVAISEAIARARKDAAAECAQQDAERRAAEWSRIGERMRAELASFREEEKFRSEAEFQERLCDMCRASGAGVKRCPCCAHGLNIGGPNAADVADVEGRAARAAAAGGGSGIVGTTLQGTSLAGEALGPPGNPHLAELERTGEIAGAAADLDDQAAAQKRDAGTK